MKLPNTFLFPLTYVCTYVHTYICMYLMSIGVLPACVRPLELELHSCEPPCECWELKTLLHIMTPLLTNDQTWVGHGANEPGYILELH